eukprot:m.52400 g.52400  ORF g.52400 m.52400 type:complete len:249 (+) comp15408_c0_seq12:375-1121(+)
MSSTNSATSCGPCARAMPSPWPKSSSSFTIRTHGMPCVSHDALRKSCMGDAFNFDYQQDSGALIYHLRTRCRYWARVLIMQLACVGLLFPMQRARPSTESACRQTCVGVPSCAAVECCGGIVAAACAHRRDARPPLADDGGGCGVQVPLSRAMGDIMGEIVMRVGQHGLVLRSEVASCIMSISVSEGLIFQLDPDLEILNFSVPYFVRYVPCQLCGIAVTAWRTCWQRRSHQRILLFPSGAVSELDFC